MLWISVHKTPCNSMAKDWNFLRYLPLVASQILNLYSSILGLKNKKVVCTHWVRSEESTVLHWSYWNKRCVCDYQRDLPVIKEELHQLLAQSVSDSAVQKNVFPFSFRLEDGEPSLILSLKMPWNRRNGDVRFLRNSLTVFIQSSTRAIQSPLIPL